jgi:hypothetical protein
MPVRQDVQGQLQTPALQGYESPGVARAQLQGPSINPDADGPSAFWRSLTKGVGEGLGPLENKLKAKAYLEGQQDNLMGKARSDVHQFMQEDYTQGYNRAAVGTDLAKFQLGIQSKALEFVNSGKTPDEFNQYVSEQTEGLLNRAGAQGMDLDSKDWQSWLQGVQSTRATSADLYQTKSVQRAEYMKGQALAAEGSAAVAVFQGADEAGNPLQALGNLQSFVDRVYTDDTLSPQQKDGAYADFTMNVMTAARSSGAVDGVSTFIQESPQFKSLPTDVQTRIMAGAQSAYQTRASDEATAVYTYASQVRAVNDPTVLNSQYPLEAYEKTLNDAQVKRQITPAQQYGLYNEEVTRRLKLEKAATMQQSLATGVTISDIRTATGFGGDKVEKALTDMYAQANGGFSGGGAALVQRGLSSGAADITAVGIGMLQEDAKSLANIDPRTLKMDPDGNPMYPSTVVNSLTNIKNTYDASVKAGNQAQANQLLSGLPDAVAYGVRQASDANSMADVVYRRASDLAAGRVVALPAKMDTALLATQDDVRAGLLDTGLTQKGSVRNILGVQSYIFNSKADELALQSRLDQVNGAVSEEYTSLYQQGKLPQLQGDDLKNALYGRVAARTVRVEDGTDAGTLLILPSVADKVATFGSTDNKIIGEALQEELKDFRTRNPGATAVQLRFDPMSNELVVSSTDKNNVMLTTSEGIPTSRIRDASKSVEARYTNGGKGNTRGALAVPGAGMVEFNAGNSFGVEPSVYQRAVNQLVSYEGYTDSKGFSILAKHPTTGATLNEAKYVKQPEDSPQVAANKLNLYLNDRVMPQVMKQMEGYNALPEFLRQKVMAQLIETTYHSGTAGMYSGFLKTILSGDTPKAYEDFRNSPLFKDAGADSRRNKDRLQLLDAVSKYKAAHLSN